MEWIKVEDRLPEKGQEVNIAAIYNKSAFTQVYQARYWGKDDFGFWIDNDPVGNAYDITHWMPLPEPPQ